MSITGQDAAPSVPLHQGLSISIPNQAAKIIPSLLSWGSWQWRRSSRPISH